MAQKVSYINADGTLRDTTDFYTVTDGTKKQPDATGETSFERTVNTFQRMKDSNIPPFLIVRRLRGAQGTSQPTWIWDDYDTGGWDWSVRRIPDVIVHKATDATDYILVGDAASWDQNVADLYNSPTYTPNLYFQSWLYAHKSICYSAPAQAISTLKRANQVLYAGDVSRQPQDVPVLYKTLGFFGNHNGRCVAVSKAFMRATPWQSRAFDVWEGCCGGPIYYINQASKGSTVFVNTLAVKYGSATLDVNYDLCISVDEAVDNWMSCILQRALEMNNIFQGYLVPETKMRHEARAQIVMRAFCNTNVESVAYPKICACIGRAGVEDALRKEMGNDLVRMVCQSTDCLDGDRTGNVYTFKPSPPCAPINICKPGLDVNAAKVTMSNVTFNCNFDEGIPPTSATTNSTPSDDKPLADKPFPKKNSSKNVKIIIGSVTGAAGIILIIIIIAVYRARKSSS